MTDDVYATTFGLVRGHRRSPGTGIVSVRGIPYAAPPFGPGRFAAPRPPEAWTGVRDGWEFGPVAPQSAELPGAPKWSEGDDGGILTVNVWTPGEVEGPLPVVVWIHGGAYSFGSSAQPDFDGTELARAGLVVVTLNYRLGFEGFGHVPGRPDNRGLLDQLAALRWVRDNIAAFGGDPGNVTVAGQSAGATSAACLATMDGARGLFRRAVLLSAVGPCYSAELAEATAREVEAAAGTPAAEASPGALVAASDRVSERCGQDPAAGMRYHDPVLYGPVVDGVILPEDPVDGLAAGRAEGIDLLVCHTTQEYRLFHAVGGTRPEAAIPGLPDGLLAGYRALMPAATPTDLYLAVCGDLVFTEYGLRLAEGHVRAGGRAFTARFDRRRAGVHPWHCADVPFVFGTHTIPEAEFLIGGPPTAADHDLSRRMIRSLAGFAATGDPGWPVDRTWTWSTGEPAEPLPDTRALWRDHRFSPERPASPLGR